MLCAGVLSLPAGFADAQAYSCYRPDPPRVPSGYTIATRAAEDLKREVDRYFADARTYVECLRSEHAHVLDEMNEIADRIDRMTDELSRR